ncbi:hypothetical protein F9278_41135 [Streptomyces phaeolivaceus]|uniref:Uncharacterized protein n=1 Tax=Streptomyces phaeolivaceus TaxID=2653200 RepID=A0A5P8KEG0_9ACTN|nr:hypothetical protein F9278_41135 [Streptomyces phaeolivaceus]
MDREAEVSGQWSYSRARRRCGIRVPLTCSTTHRFGCGTKLAALDGAQAAFLAIAGRGAEDGRVQGLLETLGVPYAGSGVPASAIGMNKHAAKTVVSAAGVRVPSGVLVDATADRQQARSRPYRSGSSWPGPRPISRRCLSWAAPPVAVTHAGVGHALFGAPGRGGSSTPTAAPAAAGSCCAYGTSSTP